MSKDKPRIENLAKIAYPKMTEQEIQAIVLKQLGNQPPAQSERREE